MKNYLVLVFVFFIALNSDAQLGFGTVKGIDLYQKYNNPVDNIAHNGSGNTLLNFIWGPRVWLGGKSFSVSVEGQINLGISSLAIKDYKGLGAVSFPALFKLNYKGLSGFFPGFADGVSLGVGMQWFKTELFYLSDKYKKLGVNRKFNKTYILQIDYGYGSFGSSGALYLRYGRNFDTKASIFNLGLIFSINNSYIKKHIKYKKNRSKE